MIQVALFMGHADFNQSRLPIRLNSQSAFGKHHTDFDVLFHQLNYRTEISRETLLPGSPGQGRYAIFENRIVTERKYRYYKANPIFTGSRLCLRDPAAKFVLILRGRRPA